MRRALVLLGYAGIASAQVSLAIAYDNRGTWWHYLLHQLVGWGLGLAVAALVMARWRVLVWPLAAAVAGQLVSIVPDLLFKYGRMPHEPSMDLWVGHISIHRGPWPVLVVLGVFLLGGWAWMAASLGRRRVAVSLALSAGLLLTGACLAADPVPERLSDYPRDSADV